MLTATKVTCKLPHRQLGSFDLEKGKQEKSKLPHRQLGSVTTILEEQFRRKLPHRQLGRQSHSSD